MSIPYEIDIYHVTEDGQARFLLGKSSQRPLLVIGLNPSKADEQKPDPTLRKVLGFASRQAYDGFVMMNLYPLRCTYPTDLPREPSGPLFRQNLQVVNEMIATRPEAHILACWGDNILIRPYLLAYLHELHSLLMGRSVHWLQIGELTAKGHPRHPVRAAYAQGFRPLDMPQYLEQQTTALR